MRLTLHRRDLHLRTPFTIARNTTTARATTIVELRDGDGITGYGEVSDNPYYTQAHPDTVAEVLGSLEGVLAEADPDRPTDLHARCRPLVGDNSFALSALDMAAHDLAARRAELPLYAYWGFEWPAGDAAPVSNYTLSIDTPERVLAQARDNPWPSYKVKLGGTHDLATVELLRAELPPATRLCVDANAGWSTVEEALAKAQALRRLGVAFLEQPMPRGGFAKTAALRSALRPGVRMPLIADEDCQTPPDVAACAEAYDAVNVKLSKCGGPTAALEMVRDARARGLGVMFGCMVESSFAIGVLRHFSPVADFIDLDGHLLVSDDPGRGIAFAPDGRPERPAATGSGVAWR